ncbi:hypothetical protein CcaCcLH18_11881 [Colletotrichum camelliae]|nr:hypothetical protein CcaCcLH18_11881 [Colletotrichum camelliae]
MASSSSGKRPSDAEWQKHKLTIERMFVQEKKSLVETRQRLENDGFLVTKAQLEYKLKVWGLRRRVPKTKSDAVWQFIGRRVQRRKEQGKETEVALGKQIFEAAKVCKEIKRYQETTIARFSQPSPMTPEGLEISLYTPAPLPVRFLWPASTPWSRFQDSFPRVFSAPSLPKNMSNISKQLRCQQGDPSLASMLRFIAPQHEPGISVTQLAAEIGAIMPEIHENDIFVRASRLLQGAAHERYSEYVEIVLYKISNNLFSVDKTSYTEWEGITKMLATSGIMKAPLQLGHVTDATMTAITEKLFQHAMRYIELEPHKSSLETSSHGRIINWLLQSGQNPCMRLRYHGKWAISVGTPLQIAARMGSLQLMSWLLDHGACPDLSYEPWNEFAQPEMVKCTHPLLETFRHYDGVDEGLLGMIERLLKISSEASRRSVIRMMMDRGRYFPELMEALIRSGTDLFQSMKAKPDQAWFIDTFSIIGSTVTYSCEPKELHPFFRLLENAGIQNRSQIPEAVNVTSIVLLAAAEGNTVFLEDLHNYGIDITAPGNLGSSVLHVAAYYGHLETCKRLVFERYAPLNAFEFNKQIPSPLHFAVAGNNLHIVRLFHQNKIDVNKPFEDQQKEWLAFWDRKVPSELFRKYREILWLNRSFTAVDLALEFFRFDIISFDIIQYLLENGAKAPSWGAWAVRYNRNDDTAQDLAKLAVKAGADPSLGAITISRPPPLPICEQFRQALERGNIVLAQQLVLNAQEDDLLWNDPDMSILEAAIITCHEQTVEKTFARNPGAYDPGALCAKVLFSSSPRDSITIRQLLSNRPRSEETSPLEALAIGLAAWNDQTEVLKLLLAEFDQPVLVNAPKELRSGLPRFSRARLAMKGLPFWHQTPWDLQSISPIIFALGSREALSLMLTHGYKPDRFTLRAATGDSDLDLLKILVKSPRLSDCHGHIQGPLSYAVTHQKDDVVQFLLENGEDVNEDNTRVHIHHSGPWESARNPLQSAVENGDLYLIDLLLKSGADVNAPAAMWNGATALQLAAIAGRLGILRTLIDHGADINAPGATRSGCHTALEGAAEHGRIDTVQYLLSIGARTTDGYRLQYLRAIRYAEIEAHEVAANLLRRHREWTTDDQNLWTVLKGQGRWGLETFALGDYMALKGNEVENASTKDGSDHLRPEENVYDPTEGVEPADDLQDLEMRTKDPMVFMIGEI